MRRVRIHPAAGKLRALCVREALIPVQHFVAIVVAACALLLSAPTARAAGKTYRVEYQVTFLPASKEALVRMTLTPGSGRVHSLDFAMDAERYREVGGDGEIRRDGERVQWTPPSAGGALHWRYRIEHRRKGGGFDARITDRFVILRGDDLVPPVRAKVSRSARARASISAVLPEGWSAFETGWRARDGERIFDIIDPERGFLRPTGWIMAGDLGVRRDVVGLDSTTCHACRSGWCGGDCSAVSVASPKGGVMRRNDTLGFVHALGPVLAQALGPLPEKILIVGADDPMWRGGLSGPHSLFLHPDRPLVSENGTSTLVHELVHVVTRLRSRSNDDWIVEGVAEYYSMLLLNRAGLLSDARLHRGIAWMRAHGKAVKRLHTARASGPVTARAVALFADLDREIGERSKGRADMDDVVRGLRARREVSVQDLRELVRGLIGGDSQVLRTRLLD